MNNDDIKSKRSFAERAAAKARSREQDELRLERGEVTAAELQRENLALRRAKGPIGIRKRDGSGYLWLSARKSNQESDR